MCSRCCLSVPRGRRSPTASGGVAVAATLLCLLAGPASAQSTARWAAQTVPRGIGSLGPIACPSTSNCCATARTTSHRLAVIATTNGGIGWGTQLLPKAAASAREAVIACPSRHECMVAGGVGPQDGEFVKASYGLLWRTTNSGHTWSSLRLPASTPDLTSISCPTVSTCYTIGRYTQLAPVGVYVGTVMLATRDGGASWSRKLITNRSSTLPVIISCPTSTLCRILALTTSDGYPAEILSSSDSGATWQAKPLPARFPALDEATFSLDCATTLACTASGGSYGRFATTTDGGAHWTLRAVSNVFIEALSCPSASTCSMAGAPWSWEQSLDRTPAKPTRFVAARGNPTGTSWQVTTLPGPSVRLPGNVSIACPATRTCWVASSQPAALFALR
jgi:hypothetical protein